MTSKRSKVPLAKTVTLTACVNKPLRNHHWPRGSCVSHRPYPMINKWSLFWPEHEKECTQGAIINLSNQYY